MKYKQLTQEERYQISALLKAGHDQSEIAMILNRDKSTISRELQRNTGLRGYRPMQAQRLADERRQSKVKTRITDTAWTNNRFRAIRSCSFRRCDKVGLVRAELCPSKWHWL